jgi:hypothetical protein
MNTLQRLKQPAVLTIAGFLMSLQVVMGMPFLLTMVGNVRHWGGWFNPRNPR